MCAKIIMKEVFMKQRYINLAYEKTYSSEIEDIKEINGTNYAYPKETNVFLGTDKIIGDKFKVNDEKPEVKEINKKLYFKSNSNQIKFEIDYNNRLDLIQQITSNAIVRMIINKTTNLKISDYQISSSYNKIILASKDISFMQIEQIESVANHLILSNLTTNNTGNILLIRGYGSVESIGPVCERIGELGLLKIKSASKDKDTISINIFSGKRAIEDYFEKCKIVENLQNILNVPSDEVIKSVKELKFNSPHYKTKSHSNTALNNSDDIKEPTKNLESNNNTLIENSITEKVSTKNSTDVGTDSNSDDKEFNKSNSKTEQSENLSDEKNIELTPEVDKNVDEKLSENNQFSNQTETKNLSLEAKKIADLATDVDGINFIYKVFRNKSIQEIISSSREISNLPNYIQILGFPMGDMSSFYVSRSKNLNMDLKAIMQTINPKLFIKSSGNMYEVEGTIATQNLATVMESFLLRIKN